MSTPPPLTFGASLAAVCNRRKAWSQSLRRMAITPRFEYAPATLGSIAITLRKARSATSGRRSAVQSALANTALANPQLPEVSRHGSVPDSAKYPEALSRVEEGI